MNLGIKPKKHRWKVQGGYECIREMRSIEVDDPIWGQLLASRGGGGGKDLLGNTKGGNGDDEEWTQHGQCPCSVQMQQDMALRDLDGGVSAGGTHTLPVRELVDGNVVCQGCFTVLGRQLDYGAEWRYYGAENSTTSNPTRCCPPSNGLIQTLGSVISGAPRRRPSQWQNRTASTAAAAAAGAAANRAVQRYQTWSSISYRDRVLCGVFDTLTVNAAQHGLSSCLLEEAKALYKKVSDARITRGDNRKAVIAASVYVSCKNNGVPRSFKEIAVMFDVRPTAMTKACRAFQEVVLDADAESSRPSDFVGRFCSQLGMQASDVDRVREVVCRADSMSLVCDAMPPSIVGGAIALVAGERGLALSRDQIAKVCVVASTTVGKLHKRLMPAAAEETMEP